MFTQIVVLFCFLAVIHQKKLRLLKYEGSEWGGTTLIIRICLVFLRPLHINPVIKRCFEFRTSTLKLLFVKHKKNSCCLKLETESESTTCCGCGNVCVCVCVYVTYLWHCQVTVWPWFHAKNHPPQETNLYSRFDVSLLMEDFPGNTSIRRMVVWCNTLIAGNRFWSNYSDLTRPHTKWWFSNGNPLIS